MKLEKLSCPSCGANIQINITDRKTSFCPYCGNQFAVDDGERIFTKNINIHKRYTDDATVEKQRVEDKENERRHKEYMWTWIFLILFFGIMFAYIGFMSMKEDLNKKKSIAAGMIQTGQSSRDMEGKKYKVVMNQLENAGFTNIITIDLDDAGWFKNKAGTVESVSIGGDSSFKSSDFFEPDAKVIISYH